MFWNNFLILLVVLAGCNSTKDAMNGQEPTHTIILQELMSNFIESQYTLVESKEALVSIFETINSTREPGMEIPSIDFSTESILLLAMGQKNTGGYSISVDRIVNEGDDWVVYVKNSAPGPTDFVTDVITTPCILVSIPKTSSNIVFKEVD